MDQIRIKEIEGELWSAADALREGSYNYDEKL